jgi:hypothetical protein
MVVGDAVFVLYEKKTVTVVMKKTDKYVPRALVEIIQEEEGDEVINSETDVAEEEKEDM